MHYPTPTQPLFAQQFVTQIPQQHQKPNETQIPQQQSDAYVFQFVPRKTGKLATIGMNRITLDVPTRAGNALLAALEEVRGKVGARLESPLAFPREDALTFAAIGLASLTKQLRAQGFREDDHYAR